MTKEEKTDLIQLVRTYARVDVAEKQVSIYETHHLPEYKVNALQALRKVGYTINLTLWPLGADDEAEELNLFTEQKINSIL